MQTQSFTLLTIAMPQTSLKVIHCFHIVSNIISYESPCFILPLYIRSINTCTEFKIICSGIILMLDCIDFVFIEAVGSEVFNVKLRGSFTFCKVITFFCHLRFTL